MKAATTFRTIPSIGLQKGAILFIGVFLIAVVAVLASVVSLTSITQQLGSARALQVEQAWYSALGRIELEVPAMLASGNCPAGGAVNIAGFSTTLSCERLDGLREGAAEYSVFTLVATASSGSAADGSLVRRSARAQFTTDTGG